MNKCWISAAVVGAGLVLCGTSPGMTQTSRPATHTITIESLEYAPKTITVKAGDSVVWVNKDPFPHTATSKAGKFDSRAIDAGKSWKHTPRTKGEFAYVCTLHPTMKAVVRVD
jgi:plastocyanin